MIALGICAAWLILTAAGFAGLTGLRSLGIREDIDAGSRSLGHPLWTRADAGASIPKQLLR